MSGMLAAALLLAWMPSLAAETAAPNKKYSLSIARTTLTSALEQFSRQSGLQITVELGSDDPQARQAGPLVGRFTVDAALHQLLAGTDLAFSWVDQYTIRVFAPVIVQPRSEDSVREVLVTGTRISGGEGPAPVRVYSRGKIERLGVSTLSSLTRYMTQQPFSFSEGYQASGAQHFQMRGLGFDTTLVLINGRRAPPSANSISLNAFDLNTIPVTAVERIEVLSDSASAIYGADAIGGVVNIILREDINDPEIYLHYGGADGGADERRIAGSIGTSGSRLKTSMVVDYFEQSPLIGADRGLWRNQDFSRFGGQDYRVATANPGNVYSVDGQPLPGLSTTFAAVPVGSSGLGLTPTDFTATAGLTNLKSPYAARTIIAESRRLTAFGSAELRLNPAVLFFGEILGGHSDVTGQRGLPSVTHEIVPATNPFNPFGRAVAVDYAFVGMKPAVSNTDSDLRRFVLGARGDLDRWHWEMAGMFSDEDVTLTNSNDVDRARLKAALQSTDTITSPNLFGDGAAGSKDLLRSLVAQSQEFRFSSGTSQMSAFARRPLYRIGESEGEFVVGGEWRREDAEFFESSRIVQRRDVTSGFAEAKLPLLEGLYLKLALRADQYDEVDDAVNPQYGIVWRPTHEWLVRAAYGTSFRPPSLFELYAPQREFQLPIADPGRGGSVSTVKLLIGGNPELDVISAHSFTAGFMFTPEQWRGLSLGSTYWRVVMDDRVIVPPVSEIVNYEDDVPGRVTRAAPSADDVLLGRRGAIQTVNISKLNYGGLETSGIDVDLSYLFEGQKNCFQSIVTATWVDKYFAQDMSSVLPLNRVDVANVQGTIPRWRVVSTLTWKRGGLGASTTAIFTPSYRDSNLTGPIARSIPSRTSLDLQGWWEPQTDILLFGGTKFTLGIRNLLDDAPDFAQAGFVAGYDLSQADMTQRFAYLRLSKSF